MIFLLSKSSFRYLLVRLFCQALDFLITISIFRFGLSIFIGNIFGYIIGSILSYVGYAKFTFLNSSEKLLSIRQISFFICSCLTGLMLSSIILQILVSFITNKESAKVLQLLSIAIIQYLFNKSLTFRKN